MPNYTVQADVVDVTTDAPKAGDVFWVDTNVWYWQTYRRASQRDAGRQPKGYQTSKYPNFLRQALRAGAKLHWIGLSLSELARQIEDAEHEIAEGLGRVPAGVNAKSYRHDYPTERQNVVRQLELCWRAVEQIAKPLPGDLVLDATAVNTALTDMASCALDAYDLFAIQAMRVAGITQVLTDDGDFCTVPGLHSSRRTGL